MDFEVQCESCGHVEKMRVDRFEMSDNLESVDIDVEDILTRQIMNGNRHPKV